MSGVNEIRAAFLDYFARNGHAVVPSRPGNGMVWDRSAVARYRI